MYREMKISIYLISLLGVWVCVEIGIITIHGPLRSRTPITHTPRTPVLGVRQENGTITDKERTHDGISKSNPRLSPNA
jgi:hypothetical protein